MRNKMINHGIAIIGIVILILLSIGSASAPPYGGPDAEVTYVEIDVEKRTINSNPAYYAAGTGFKLINSHLDRNIFEISVSTGIYGSDSIKFDRKTIEELFPLFDIRSKNVPYPTTVYISVHPKDPANPNADLYYRLDRIEFPTLLSLEEAQAIVAREEAEAAKRAVAEAERAAQAEARQAQQEQTRRAEQERLANLYRQAGNNLGNLRNTSRRYGTDFGRDYLTTIYNFGDGNYIVQTQSILGLSFSPKTGTYRVNGDTVIFLSTDGNYSYGTIVGTALNIGGDIYR